MHNRSPSVQLFGRPRRGQTQTARSSLVFREIIIKNARNLRNPSPCEAILPSAATYVGDAELGSCRHQKNESRTKTKMAEQPPRMRLNNINIYIYSFNENEIRFMLSSTERHFLTDVVGSKLQTGELIFNSGAVTATIWFTPCNQRSICKDGCKCPL